MLKVTNIRLGFANNSSSSHSILLCNAGHTYQDYLVDEMLDEEQPYFGWERFICASKEAKAKYFACQLAETLRRDVGAEIAGLTIRALFNLPEYYGKGVVDHQSCLSFPCYQDGTIAMGFIREMFDRCINNPCVVVGGGNDNRDDDRADIVGEHIVQIASLPRDHWDSKMIVRPEPYGWCLFNPTTGARVRLQRDEATSDLPVTPELVDVKITDKCNKNCSWCYQGSNYQGKHANKDTLQHLAYALGRMNVFEVVFGGGEPTQHPDFLEILQSYKYNNIVTNFTTADTQWLENPEFVAKVVECVGSIAFSCNTLYEMRYTARRILLAGKKITEKAVIQSIVGIVPADNLSKMLEIAKELGFWKYSLVGFKQAGRAPQKPPCTLEDYNLYNLIKNSPLRFYADTALLKQFPEIVEKSTCDVAEGKQSMYIDAVSRTMAASSYIGDTVPWTQDKHIADDEILNAFHGFQKKCEEK